ncbi:MAG TPA: hypothetical protein VGX25_17575, partial [Actinophytocola sp.]|nr:hypothetical protein [Actinophytocola sp.]
RRRRGPPDHRRRPAARQRPGAGGECGVQAQTIMAVSRAADYVIYSKGSYGTGYYEIWMDKPGQRIRTDTYTQLPRPFPCRRTEG